MTAVHVSESAEMRDGRPSVRPVAGLRRRSVVVTGGAGFIGSSLCRVLLASGAKVTVVDNLATGSAENLPPGPEGFEQNLELMVADVRDEWALSRAFAGADVVYHLACLGVRHSLRSPVANHDVNAGGALCVLEQARRARVGRVVHVSSSEVYGDAVTTPMSEAHPTRPHTVYGAGKLAGESYALALHRTHDLDVVVIRAFNAYGPRSHFEGDAGEVIPRFIVQALHGDPLYVFGSGGQTRDLTHVYDTAVAIARAGVAPDVAGRIYNVGSGTEVSVDRLAGLIRAITGSDSLVVHTDERPGDVVRLVADSSNAANDLDHRVTVSLAAGLDDLVRRMSSGEGAIDEMAGAVEVRNWV